MSVVDHAKLACVSDAGKFVGIGTNYEKTFREKVGSAMLKPFQAFPGQVATVSCWGFRWTLRQLCNPNVITAALTTGTIIGATYACYHDSFQAGVGQLGLTETNVQNLIKKHFTANGDAYRSALKAATFAVFATCAAGFGLRATGRFSNPSLMEALQRKHEPIKAQPNSTQEGLLAKRK